MIFDASRRSRHAARSAAKSKLLRRVLCLEALEERRVLDSTVVFNELNYHPSANEAKLEWIELYNQQAVDMDISGWRLNGGVEYTFPQGTYLKGGNHLVVAVSPADFQAATGVSGAFGPFTGRLDNGGEKLELISNSGRLMDVLEYGDDGAWPAAPDGSGLTLAKINPDAGTAEPANWSVSKEIGGTPGARNFTSTVPQFTTTTIIPIDASWRYYQSGAQATGWQASGFADASWSSGPALFHIPNSQTYPATRNTALTAGQVTYYFRTHFTAPAELTGATLQIHSIVDDGAVYYLNGQEIYRQSMPAAPTEITPTTLASPAVGIANWTGPITVPSSALHAGDNVLAVEVHQATAGSTDLAFGTELILTQPVGVQVVERPSLAINEVGAGSSPDFAVELYNYGTSAIPLGGMVLAHAGAINTDYALPNTSLAPGAYLSLSAAQLGFTGVGGDKLFLYTTAKSQVVDAVVVKPSNRGRSPNGTGDWFYTTTATFGGANNVSLHDEIVINEIMYHHRPTPDQPAQYAETSIFPIDAVWKYDDSGVDRGVAWRAANYDDAAWASGAGLLANETATLPAAKNTQLAANRNTYYFRRAFDFAGDPLTANLSINALIDDGAVFYLNGVEVYRVNMPAGDIEFNTSASTVVDNASYSGPLIIPASALASALVAGQNTLAVEVHQATAATGGGPAISPQAGYEISWDGSNGAFFTAASPANAPANAALASNGVVPFGSSEYGAGKHLIANINDGLYGNNESWLSNFPAGDANPYIGMRFNQTLNLTSIAWGRDNGNTVNDDCGGTCTDRSNGTYTIQITNVASPGTGTAETGNDATGWKTIGTLTYSGSNAAFTPYLRHRYNLSTGGAPISATGLRIKVSDNNIAIDEIELNAAVDNGNSDIVFGAALASVVQTSPGSSFAENDEEWIELYNRSGSPVDLTGWRLDEGIDYDFPAGTIIPAGGYLVVSNDMAALRAEYPDPSIKMVGDFSGSLANSGDRIVLKDPRNNPADDVRYYDGGAWSALADGGGSSLELTDADGDNSHGEAWKASDESAKSQWQTFTYRGIPATEFAPARWNEFVLGLFGDGEVLLDDISVRESPGGSNTQKIVNTSFQTDTIGAAPSAWRMVGNHRNSIVVADPTNPTNKVLKLVSTGQTQDRSNHAETTFINNLPAANGLEYEISFKAKWLSGTDRLDARLYFNRLARTINLAAPQKNGTPGTPNSTRVNNAGPTYTGFAATPVVPAAGEPVVVSVRAADPDNVASMAVRYSVNGGALASAAMTLGVDGIYRASLPGQAASAIVQFFVEGVDALGASSTYPAAGAASRALYKVQDNQANAAGKHSVRIIMTTADANILHDVTNVMSSEEMRATVVYDEHEVYYNVGVSLKGSMAARPNSVYTSFRVVFNPEQLFRGVHPDIALDRSGRGAIVGNGQDEIITKQMMTAAGGIPSQYDDLVYVVSPRGTESGPALLMLGEFSDVYLDEQFDGGGGTLYNFDLIYIQNATTNGLPDGLKTPVGYVHPGYNPDFENLGDDKEAYRWYYRVQNNRSEDDFTDIIAFAKSMSLTGSTPGGALDLATQQTMDVDEWMRVFAAQSLSGSGPDLYGRGLAHNIRLYNDPDTGKITAFPWDWDLSVMGLATNADVFPSGNIRKVVEIPANKRLFYGHLIDLMATSFNRTYMTYWINHFNSLLPGQNFNAALTYIDNRNAYVTSQLPPQVTFSASSGATTNTTTLVDASNPLRVLVPSAVNPGTGVDWKTTAFNDSSWTAGTGGVGYERTQDALNYRDQIGVDVLSAIDTNNDGTNETNTVYIRIPFDAPATAFDQLKLRMKYDDGFVAYINGTKVAERNAPATLDWNGEATVIHDDTQAVIFEDIDITAFRSAIVPGQTNVLAIHGLNRLATSGDMLIAAELIGSTTTSGTNVLETDQDRITLGGSAWVNVHDIYLQGQSQPLKVTWTNVNTWQAVVPLKFGTQTLTFEGRDLHGAVVATDEVIVNSTFSDHALADNLRITELMYHPADPTAEEQAAGYNEADEFEYLELHNNSATATLDLTGVKIAGGIDFDFADATVTSIPPGGYVVLVESLEAFAQRYGAAPVVAGKYTGRLSNSGEALQLLAPNGAEILAFAYDDGLPDWHPTTDGDGYSLVIIDATGPTASWNNGAAWRPSAAIGGSPGRSDGGLAGDLNGDGRVGLADLAILQSHLGTTSGALASDGDLDGDGDIDRGDAARFMTYFGASTPPGSPAASPVAPAAIIARRNTTIAATRRLPPHEQPAAEQAASPNSALRARRSISPAASDAALSDEALTSLTTLRARRSR